MHECNRRFSEYRFNIAGADGAFRVGDELLTMQNIDRRVFADQNQAVFPEDKAKDLGKTPLLEVLADIEAGSFCQAMVGDGAAHGWLMHPNAACDISGPSMGA